MADWQTVRYDPSYPEPLDAEIIPLCDAMNDAGVVTTASCCGHGVRWPLVCFEDGDEARIERMARHVLAAERAAGDYQPSFSEFNRETQPDGHAWTLHIHLNNVYRDTPPAQALGDAVAAINRVAALVREWAASETGMGGTRAAPISRPPVKHATGPVSFPPPAPNRRGAMANQLIAEHFASYEREVLSPDAGDVQRSETRMAFYAGAQVAVALVASHLDDERRDFLLHLYALNEELGAFAFTIADGALLSAARARPASETPDAPRCTVCGKQATRQDINGEWWPPCEHAIGLHTLRYGTDSETPAGDER